MRESTQDPDPNPDLATTSAPDRDWPCRCQECASPDAACDVCGMGASEVCDTRCSEHPSRRPPCARIGTLSVVDLCRWRAIQAQRRAAIAAEEARACLARWQHAQTRTPKEA
jgi:hypothetical protein